LHRFRVRSEHRGEARCLSRYAATLALESFRRFPAAPGWNSRIDLQPNGSVGKVLPHDLSEPGTRRVRVCIERIERFGHLHEVRARCAADFVRGNRSVKLSREVPVPLHATQASPQASLA